MDASKKTKPLKSRSLEKNFSRGCVCCQTSSNYSWGTPLTILFFMNSATNILRRDAGPGACETEVVALPWGLPPPRPARVGGAAAHPPSKSPDFEHEVLVWDRPGRLPGVVGGERLDTCHPGLESNILSEGGVLKSWVLEGSLAGFFVRHHSA